MRYGMGGEVVTRMQLTQLNAAMADETEAEERMVPSDPVRCAEYYRSQHVSVAMEAAYDEDMELTIDYLVPLSEYREMDLERKRYRAAATSLRDKLQAFHDGEGERFRTAAYLAALGWTLFAVLVVFRLAGL